MLDAVHSFSLLEKLQSFLDENESLSKTSDVSKEQGYDFLLEEINRDFTSWIRLGVATDNMWLGVCRDFDWLNELRRKLTHFSVELMAQVPKKSILIMLCDWSVCLT